MEGNGIQPFGNERVRRAWDEEEQKWLFSIVDVCAVLTDQPTQRGASNYWAKLKERLSEEKADELLTNCKRLKMTADDGKMRMTDVADAEQLLQIMQSISSPKTESFRSWLESIESGATRPSTENIGEMILYQPDNSVKLDVFLENDTVWLTQAQMAELFQTTRPNITMHIKNVFDEGELKEVSVSKDFLHTAADGKRYATRYYNLDVIISVGYRVKSLRGVRFRQWASGVLKDYILRGYAINQRFERIEERVAETEKQIGFIVRASQPPTQGLFLEGQTFVAYAFVSDIIRSAKESIVLLDNYVNDSVLLLLSKRSPGVSAEIYTKHISPQLKLDIERHNSQFPRVNVHESDKFHDRFLIIDHTVYYIGSSIKDVGKKMLAFSKTEISDRDILDNL